MSNRFRKIRGGFFFFYKWRIVFFFWNLDSSLDTDEKKILLKTGIYISNTLSVEVSNELSRNACARIGVEQNWLTDPWVFAPTLLIASIPPSTASISPLRGTHEDVSV